MLKIYRSVTKTNNDCPSTYSSCVLTVPFNKWPNQHIHVNMQGWIMGFGLVVVDRILWGDVTPTKRGGLGQCPPNFKFWNWNLCISRAVVSVPISEYVQLSPLDTSATSNISTHPMNRLRCVLISTAMNIYDLLLIHPDRGAGYCKQFVCLCVCLSVTISLEPLDRSSQNVLSRSPVAAARSSSSGVAIRYVLWVLWMMSHMVIAVLRYRGRVWCLRMHCLHFAVILLWLEC